MNLSGSNEIRNNNPEGQIKSALESIKSFTNSPVYKAITNLFPELTDPHADYTKLTGE